MGGFTEVLGPYLNLETLTHEYIPVELIVRAYLKDLNNAYIVVQFACCREIKTLSEFEVNKLKEKFEESKD